jgi:SAM-dependent methyltransferase
VQLLDVRMWSAAASPEERNLLAKIHGPTLDVGCGPGRLVEALAERGVPVLGIDVAPSALHQARHRGPVLDRSVFDPLPGEGRWRSVLLFDGNIGIGGDPHALMRRVAELLAVNGIALVEVEVPGSGLSLDRVVLECDGECTPAFPWAWVDADALAGPAAAAGLTELDRREVDGRWFVWLARRRPEPVGS